MLLKLAFVAVEPKYKQRLNNSASVSLNIAGIALLLLFTRSTPSTFVTICVIVLAFATKSLIAILLNLAITSPFSPILVGDSMI